MDQIKNLVYPREFPGGLAVGTIHFHCRGKGLIPGQGTERSYKLCSQKIKIKNTSAHLQTGISIWWNEGVMHDTTQMKPENLMLKWKKPHIVWFHVEKSLEQVIHKNRKQTCWHQGRENWRAGTARGCGGSFCGDVNVLAAEGVRCEHRRLLPQRSVPGLRVSDSFLCCPLGKAIGGDIQGLLRHCTPADGCEKVTFWG